MGSAIDIFQNDLFAIARTHLGQFTRKWLLDLSLEDLASYKWKASAVLAAWGELSGKVAELATEKDELVPRVWILEKHGTVKLKIEWRIEHERFRGARLHDIIPHEWIGPEKARDSSARSYVYPINSLEDPENGISCSAQKISARVIVSLTAPCECLVDRNETVENYESAPDLCVYVSTENVGMQRMLVGIARHFAEDVRAVPNSYDLKRLVERKMKITESRRGKSHILLLQNDLSASEVAPLSWEAGVGPAHAFDYVIHLTGMREPGSVVHETISRRSTLGLPGRRSDVVRVIREAATWLRMRNEARKLEFQLALDGVDPSALGDSVAIVDDQFLLRSFVKDMLKDRGWKVSEYDGSAPEFLLRFGNSSHDLVLVNVGLPVETQKSIAEAVNRSVEFRHPPVVMGYSEESARSQLFLSSLASLVKFTRRQTMRMVLPEKVVQSAD